MKTKHTLAALGVGVLIMAGSGIAAYGQDDGWRFGVTIPLWAAGIDGDVTLGGNTADVDIGFDEITDHLDASLSLGLEARKGKFGLYTGIGYMKFGAEGSTAAGANADASLKFIIGDAGVSYLLVKTEGENPFVLEGLVGLRYWRTDTELTLKNAAGTVLFSGGKERNLVDPVIGLRGSKYLSEKWHLDFQGDIGGFGISDSSSDLTWSAAGLVSYDFARWFTLSAGYKALAVNVSQGSGASENAADIAMHGALIAAKFKF